MDWRDGGAASKPRPGVKRLVGERPWLWRLRILAQLGTWGEARKLPQACFLSAKQMCSHPLSRLVVTSAGHCAGVNSRVFTPVILPAALGGGNYFYPHFPDGDTEAHQLAQCHLASGREGTVLEKEPSRQPAPEFLLLTEDPLNSEWSGSPSTKAVPWCFLRARVTRRCHSARGLACPSLLRKLPESSGSSCLSPIHRRSSVNVGEGADERQNKQAVPTTLIDVDPMIPV